MSAVSNHSISCQTCGIPLAAGITRGLCPRCLARSLLTGDTPESDPRFPIPFGDYELLEEIARGGMGVVYRARQLSLDRIVAVKLLLSGEFATRDFVQRFRSEAATAALLRHPNIVAIHEVGVQGGQHFFSMDYVAGKDLAQTVGHLPLPAPRAARYVQIIAEAVHFAHGRGVLHRDLKPSNVLIDEADQPRITDFGLAKRLDQSTNLTVTGQVLGSPGFMSPEQSGAPGGRVGRTSDVYSLGAVLYQTLTARPPFVGETVQQVLRQVSEAEPLAPRSINPSVPVDLETICLKCLAKEPAQRYQTAAELAAELARVLTGEPIHARPARWHEKLRRWCRRKPALAGLSATLAICLITGTWAVLRELRRAEQAESAATENLSRSYLEQARATRRTGRGGHRFGSLEAIRKAVSLPVEHNLLELRNEAIATLALVDARPLRHVPATHPPGPRVLFDPTVERYAVSDPKGAIHIHRVKDEALLLTVPPFGTNLIRFLAWSRNSRWLALLDAGGRRLICDLDERRVACELPPGTPQLPLEFSPTEDQLAVLGPDRSVQIRSLPDGRLLHTLEFETPPALIAYRPDGKALSVCGLDESYILLVDPASDRRQALWSRSPVSALRWHPSDHRLVAACSDYSIQMWNLPDPEPKRILTDHQSRITALAWQPGGDAILSFSWDGQTKAWEATTGRLLSTTAGSGARPQFTTDGRQLALLTRTGGTLWEVVPNRVCRSLQEPTGLTDSSLPGPWSSAFSGDHRLLATASYDGVHLWDVAAGREAAHLPTLGTLATVLFHPTEPLLIASGPQGVRQWPIQQDPQGQPWSFGPSSYLSRGGGKYHQASISTNGLVFAYAHGDSITVWTNGHRAFHLPHPWPRATVVSPQGHWIASASAFNSETKLWNAQSAQLVWTCRPSPTSVASDLAFTPDGEWLITAGADTFQFWNVRTGLAGRKFPRFEAIDLHGALAFSPDGTMLALSLTRNLVQLRAFPDGHELARLESPNPQMISHLAFDQTGTQLAVSGENHILQVWDLRTLREELSLLDLDWDHPPFPPAAAMVKPPLQITVLPPRLGIPPRSLDVASNLVDLTPFYNAALGSLWEGDEGNNLNLVAGTHTLGGVAYDVRGAITLQGKLLAHRPSAVRDVPIHRKCGQLHFLQGAAREVPQGTPIGCVVIHYQDGRREEALVRYGLETHNWWVKPTEAPGRAETVWLGVNPPATAAGYVCALFHSGWTNSRPEAVVATVDFVSFGTECSPFLVALTIE